MNYAYPLGTGTVDNNIELRISLRSVEKFDPDCNVVVVGERPSWANDNLVHIPCPDINKHNNDGNMINKVLKVCDFWEDDFVRMSDDQVVMNTPNFTPYWDGRLSDMAHGNPDDATWFKRIHATSRFLLKNNFTDHFFDLHCPVRINATQYGDTMNKLDKYYLFYDRGYLINSIYFNMIGLNQGVGAKHVVRLRTELFDPEYIERFTFLNYKNRSFTKQLRKYLLSKFDKPSKFEN